MISEEKQIYLNNKYNQEGSDLRKAQLRMLKMLIAFDKICKENDLTYWLASGTLLGAARHQGFIPWDDDLDVFMPRKDVSKLKKVFGKNIIYNFLVFQDIDTDPGDLGVWPRIRDIKTENTNHETFHDRLKYKGLAIDVFIVDEGVNIKLKKKLNILYDLFVNQPIYRRKYRFIKPFAKLNCHIFNKLVFPFFRLWKFNDKISEGYGCIYGKYQDKETIYPLKEIEFEGYKFPCPNNVPKYLEVHYGDWERIPDETEIHTHDVQIKFYE